MTIDVIEFTDGQFASLTDEQILEVKSAQLKKNRLAKKLADDKKAEKYRLLKNGVFRSEIWQQVCDELETAYRNEVENIKDGLAFYLRFSIRIPSGTAPYTIDYSLSYEERLRIVRGYYDGTYPNAAEKFAAFRADEFALGYLGDRYGGLYEFYSAAAE